MTWYDWYDVNFLRPSQMVSIKVTAAGPVTSAIPTPGQRGKNFDNPRSPHIGK